MTPIQRCGLKRLMLRLPSWRAAFAQNSDDPAFVDICEAYELVWSVLDSLTILERPEATGRIREYRELAAVLEADALIIAKDSGGGGRLPRS